MKVRLVTGGVGLIVLGWQEGMFYKDRGVFLNFLNRYGEKCKYVRVVVKTKCIGRNG